MSLCFFDYSVTSGALVVFQLLEAFLVFSCWVVESWRGDEGKDRGKRLKSCVLARLSRISFLYKWCSRQYEVSIVEVSRVRKMDAESSKNLLKYTRMRTSKQITFDSGTHQT